MTTVLRLASPLSLLHALDEPPSSRAIDRRAERLVLHALREGLLFANTGRAARWRSEIAEGPGWDIDFDTGDGERVAVTVKATTEARLASFELSEAEWRAAQRLEHLYWLALVTDVMAEQSCIELAQDPAKSQREGRLIIEPGTLEVRRDPSRAV